MPGARAERASAHAFFGVCECLASERCLLAKRSGVGQGQDLPANLNPARLPAGRAARRRPAPHSAVRRVQGGGAFRQSSRAPCTKLFPIVFFWGRAAPPAGPLRGGGGEFLVGRRRVTSWRDWLQSAACVFAIWGAWGARCLPVPRAL